MNTNTVPVYLKNLLSVMLLIICTWKVSSGLEQQMDIRFYDESYYLTQGLFHPVSDWISDYSPLYSLWYKGAGQLFPEPISLYLFAFRFWTFFLGIFIFALLRFGKVSRVPALLWAMASISSQLALPLWPKAGHLAMAGTSFGIIGLYIWRKQLMNQLIWIAGIGFLFAFCRPEFLSAALAAGLFLPIAWSQKDSNKMSLPAFTPIMAGIACFFLWGIPAGQSGRGLVAFGQHFVHNWHNISGSANGDLMVDWVNWRPIFFQHFGEVSNPWQAFVANPADMLQHLWFNLRYLFYNALVYFSETMFPFRIIGFSSLYSLVALLAFCEWNGSFRTAEHFFQKFRSLSLLRLLPWIFLAMPSLMAGFLFQPRPHYILPLLPFFVFGWALYAQGLPKVSPSSPARLASVFLPIIFLFFTPDTHSFFRLGNKKQPTINESAPEENAHFGVITSPNLAHRTLVEELRKYPFPEGFRIFDASTGASEYLGRKLVQCGKTGFEMDYDALQNFPAFLDSARVNGILIHNTIYYDHFFTQNPFWQMLRSRPAQIGWRKVPVGMEGDSLLLRN